LEEGEIQLRRDSGVFSLLVTEDQDLGMRGEKKKRVN